MGDEQLPGPPQDVEAERAVLGGMMLSKNAITDASEILHGSDFYRPVHESIFTAIMHLYVTNQPADQITVSSELQRRNELDNVGGAAYIHQLAGATPAVASVPFYADIVKKKSTLRQLGAAGRKITQLAGTGGSPTDAVQQARALVDSCTDLGEGGILSMAETIDATLTRLTEKARFVPTPWDALNQIMSGWRPGAQHVIGARPGVGKTLVGLQAALALADNGNVLFTSMEMSRDELQGRAIAQLAEIPTGNIDRRSLTDSQWQNIADARQRLLKTLYIDDRANQTPTTIRSAARTVARAGKLSGIVVDYIQLMTDASGIKRNRQEQVSDFSRQLKLLAKDLDVPVITLSQLNRQSEARNDKRPLISDMRDSGAVEQDADIVLLLHRDMEKSPGLISIAVAKNRHGLTGGTELKFDGAYSRVLDRPRTAYSAYGSTDRRDLN
ncbi:replicative DNA helicase [Arthrobacter silviterrae]|uniref:replicative DNA helicase n=1 Tax=Arthrobacter silviterrae TaxID=2026658 RepID=UPI0023F34ADB|nr:replicative DNA helicase [Arthrobacter silviterrae]